MFKSFSQKGLPMLLAGLCLIPLLTGIAFGRSYVGGSMYTRDGQKIEVLSFLDPLNKDDVVINRSDDKITKVRIADISEINFLTANVNYIYPHSKIVQESGILSLRLRDGKSVMLTDAYFDKGTLTYVVLTPENRKEEKKIKLREVSKIRFEQASGKLRICPIDQAAFSDDYIFCPYHGVPLTWGNP